MRKLKRFPEILPDGTIEIPLTHGFVTHIDSTDADLAEVMWHSTTGRTLYAKRTINKRPENPKTILMHQIILERILGRPLINGEKPDHIDLNGLNNRRSNLRLASDSQNGANRCLQRNNRSGYKGVHYSKAAAKWVAQMTFHGSVVYLGAFDDPGEASEAYKKAALERHGKFARFD
jgi:hypothetical protein